MSMNDVLQMSIIHTLLLASCYYSKNAKNVFIRIDHSSSQKYFYGTFTRLFITAGYKAYEGFMTCFSRNLARFLLWPLNCAQNSTGALFVWRIESSYLGIEGVTKGSFRNDEKAQIKKMRSEKEK